MIPFRLLNINYSPSKTGVKGTLNMLSINGPTRQTKHMNCIYVSTSTKFSLWSWAWLKILSMQRNNASKLISECFNILTSSLYSDALLSYFNTILIGFYFLYVRFILRSSDSWLLFCLLQHHTTQETTALQEGPNYDKQMKINISLESP
jgi:hypothetical protein